MFSRQPIFCDCSIGMVYLLEKKFRKGVQGIPNPNGGFSKLNGCLSLVNLPFRKEQTYPPTTLTIVNDLNLKVSLKIDRL